MARATRRRVSPSLGSVVEDSQSSGREAESESHAPTTPDDIDMDDDDEEGYDDDEGELVSVDEMEDDDEESNSIDLENIDDGSLGETQADGPSPNVILGDLDDLNEAAGRLIKLYLKEFHTSSSTTDRFTMKRDALYKEFSTLANRYNNGRRCIDPEKMAAVLGIQHELHPIFTKANLAVLAHMLCRDQRGSYYQFGGFEDEFIRNGGCTYTDDRITTDFITEWRTQIYVRAVLDLDIFEQERADKFLVAIFFDDEIRARTDTTSVLKDGKMEAAHLRGWQTDGSSPPVVYHEKIIERVRYLHNLTQGGEFGLLRDNLAPNFPYQQFEAVVLDWLKTVNMKLADSYPSLETLANAAYEGKDDLEMFRRRLKSIMPRPTPTPQPSVEQADPRRTATGAHANANLDLISGVAALRGHAGPSTPGPSRVNPRVPATAPPHIAASRQRASNAPPDPVNYPSISATGSTSTTQIGWDVNRALEDVAKGDKENQPKPKEKKFFNQSQEGARQVSPFDDAAELHGPTTSTQRPAQRPAAPQTQDEDITMGGDDEEDDDFERMPPVRPTRPRPAPEVANSEASRPTNRISRQQDRVRATYPRPQRASNPDNVEEGEDVAPAPRIPVVTGRAARRTWPQGDIEKLYQGVAAIGIRWADIRDVYLNNMWTNVDIKDKARNLKFDLLKKMEEGEELPTNFEHVSLGNTYIDRLAKQGVIYVDGETSIRRRTNPVMRQRGY